MRVDVFTYAPKSGDYGSDWKLYAAGMIPSQANGVAFLLRDRGEYVRIFTHAKRGIGKLLLELGNGNMMS